MIKTAGTRPARIHPPPTLKNSTSWRANVEGRPPVSVNFPISNRPSPTPTRIRTRLGVMAAIITMASPRLSRRDGVSRIDHSS